MILIKFGLFEAEDKKRPVFILACHVMVNSVFLRPKLLNFKVLNPAFVWSFLCGLFCVVFLVWSFLCGLSCVDYFLCGLMPWLFDESVLVWTFLSGLCHDNNQQELFCVDFFVWSNVMVI